MILGSMCAGDVRCYAAMVKAGEVVIDATECHLPLRHSHHRYVIDAPNGPVKLTVPLVGGTNAMPVPMRDVLVSEHGNWRHLHWGALYSSYGKSPFFDFIADELHHIIIEGKQQHLLDFNMELHQLIADFMDLPINISVVSDVYQIAAMVAGGALDLRGKIGGKRPDTLPLADVPYYQMWSNRRGSFSPRLSILDLLMNEGREGVITLLKMGK